MSNRHIFRVEPSEVTFVAEFKDAEDLIYAPDKTRTRQKKDMMTILGIRENNGFQYIDYDFY